MPRAGSSGFGTCRWSSATRSRPSCLPTTRGRSSRKTISRTCRSRFRSTLTAAVSTGASIASHGRATPSSAYRPVSTSRPGSSRSEGGRASEEGIGQARLPRRDARCRCQHRPLSTRGKGTPHYPGRARSARRARSPRRDRDQVEPRSARPRPPVADGGEGTRPRAGLDHDARCRARPEHGTACVDAGKTRRDAPRAPGCGRTVRRACISHDPGPERFGARAYLGSVRGRRRQLGRLHPVTPTARAQRPLHRLARDALPGQGRPRSEPAERNARRRPLPLRVRRADARNRPIRRPTRKPLPHRHKKIRPRQAPRTPRHNEVHPPPYCPAKFELFTSD